MIVNKIYISDICTIETKHDAPIARDADRPVASKIALEGMQPKAWKVHVPGLRRLIEASQDAFNLVGVLRR
jgi:hypothetical protein